MNRREELAARNLTQKYIDGTLPEYIADFGRQILAEGGVGKFTLREEEEVWTAEATVQGEDFQAYRPVLTVNFRDQRVDGACNCMEAFNGPCRHIAAVAQKLVSSLAASEGEPEE